MMMMTGRMQAMALVGRAVLGVAAAVTVMAAPVSSGGVASPDYSKCRKVRRRGEGLNLNSLCPDLI